MHQTDNNNLFRKVEKVFKGHSLLVACDQHVKQNGLLSC